MTNDFIGRDDMMYSIERDSEHWVLNAPFGFLAIMAVSKQLTVIVTVILLSCIRKANTYTFKLCKEWLSKSL